MSKLNQTNTNTNSSINSIEISLDREKKSRFRENLGKKWYKFSKNKLSVVGLVIVIGIIILAVFAPWIAPYPEHSGPFVDLYNAGEAPSLQHICGTDNMGRDIFSRIIFAYRGALLIPLVVLIIAVPVGVVLGLIAGYFQGTWIDNIAMRATDIFVSVPPLILALAIAAVLKPTLMNSFLAITVVWWPWHTRLVYGMATSLNKEYFVVAAHLTGASKFHILFREILPNCLSPIFTKMALDVGWIIIIGASLSFVGLGEQPPTPALGQMVSDGGNYMPTFWWMSIFPALAIVIIILGFNLMGDGIRDMFEVEGN